MDPGDPDEPSREELVERVDELEANQAEQREWWQEALPSRRGVLTAGAGLGLGALLSGSASGQSAAGQVGTQSSPEDVFAYDLDVQGALQRDLDAGGQAISNVGSVSTGIVELITQGGSDWDAETQDIRGSRDSSINDDTTATFITEQLSGFTLLAKIRRFGDVGVAVIAGRSKSTPQASVIVSGGPVTIETTTNDVTGTTGTDGNITISIRDGAVEIENRIGGPITAELTIIGE